VLRFQKRLLEEAAEIFHPAGNSEAFHSAGELGKAGSPSIGGRPLQSVSCAGDAICVAAFDSIR
jgi:hypothetical protein